MQGWVAYVQGCLWDTWLSAPQSRPTAQCLFPRPCTGLGSVVALALGRPHPLRAAPAGPVVSLPCLARPWLGQHILPLATVISLATGTLSITVSNNHVCWDFWDSNMLCLPLGLPGSVSEAGDDGHFLATNERAEGQGRLRASRGTPVTASP